MYTFRSELWQHQGPGASWFFLTVPDDVSDEIEELTEDTRKGFGSVRVRVTVGSSTWSTSLFPDSTAKAYVLPVKKAVRATEGIGDGDQVEVHLELT